jgi:hypothetical protein
MTSPAEHRHLGETAGAMIAPPSRQIQGKESTAAQRRLASLAEKEFRRNRCGTVVRVTRTRELCLPVNRIDGRAQLSVLWGEPSSTSR